ncbi:MAG: HNH endonuclease, partial [bacterium]
MKTHCVNSPTRLTDDALLARVHDLARCERRTTVELIAHLAEMDRRRLHLAEGCSSLFTYCTEVLHFSEHAAYNRIECARVARRFPLVLEKLAEGSVHLTAVRLLSPHLTPDNHAELLDHARHLGKRGVELLVASLRPLPDVPSLVRRLPLQPAPMDADQSMLAEMEVTGASLTGMEVRGTTTEGRRPGGPVVGEPIRVAPAPAATVKPLAPERY